MKLFSDKIKRVLWFSNGKIWKKRDIIMILTKHDDKFSVSKPQIIKNYNKAKIFVELKDRLKLITSKKKFLFL